MNETSDRQALNAIYRILINDGKTADPSILAREILTALRGHGWRPTQAQPPQSWQPTLTHARCEAPHQLIAETRDAINKLRAAKP